MNSKHCSPEEIDSVPDRPAIFLVWAREGAPYLGRTALLRRRLRRLLQEREQPSRFLNLRGVAERIEYWLTGSQLEAGIVYYELARRHFPDDYRRIARLRFPPYVKLTLSNRFPRTLVTTRLGGGRSLYYGPFRTRASAEEFEKQMLDLFQIRRCQEELEPSPAHPGCIYGEMNLCLRPCQKAVTAEEYGSEVARVVTFLETDGASLLSAAGAARERASVELNFEEAAQHHKWYERVEKVLAARDDLAREASKLGGVAVTKSVAESAVELWFMLNGAWLASRQFALTAPVSMDQRLKEVVAGLPPATGPKAEDVAILARWYYSSWRDGDWLPFESPGKIPYRKLVNAISRVAANKLE